MTIEMVKANVIDEFKTLSKSLPDDFRSDVDEAIAIIAHRECNDLTILFVDKVNAQYIIEQCYFQAIMWKIGSIESKIDSIKG